MANRTLDSHRANGRSPAVHVTFPRGLLSRARQHADDDGVTLSAWIRDAVRAACGDADAVADASAAESPDCDTRRRITELRRIEAQLRAAVREATDSLTRVLADR